MLCLRLILAWLLLAALPLQGWAAATMLFCGPAPQQAVTATANPHGHAVQGAHDDAHEVSDGHHAGAVAGDTGGADDGAQTVANGFHSCGVCSACCNGAALAQTQQTAAVAVAPGTHLPEAPVAVLARPSSVPDKPPRA